MGGWYNRRLYERYFNHSFVHCDNDLFHYKNRTILKELSKFQIFGVGISYFVAIFLAFMLIYYGGNWVAW